jgi:hypothetical protein
MKFEAASQFIVASVAAQQTALWWGQRGAHVVLHTQPDALTVMPGSGVLLLYVMSRSIAASEDPGGAAAAAAAAGRLCAGGEVRHAMLMCSSQKLSQSSCSCHILHHHILTISRVLVT